MVHTYSTGDKIYSVDMMIAYINIFKPIIIQVDIKLLLDALKYKSWGHEGTLYSPLDVLKNKTNKKYSNEIKRINNADLSYPIIIHKNNIIDGVHRLTKAYLLDKKKIKAYIFSSKDMNKFLIDTHRDWNKIDQLNTHDFIYLFYKKFLKK